MFVCYAGIVMNWLYQLLYHDHDDDDLIEMLTNLTGKHQRKNLQISRYTPSFVAVCEICIVALHDIELL